MPTLRLAAPIASRGFQWVNADVFPVVAIVTGASIFATAFGIRTLYASTDVMCAHCQLGLLLLIQCPLLLVPAAAVSSILECRGISSSRKESSEKSAR